MLLRGLEEYNFVRVSNSAMQVVDVKRRLVGRLPRGEHSAGVPPTTDVDPVAVKAEQGPTQRKYDGPL